MRWKWWSYVFVEWYYCECLESGWELFENFIKGNDKKIFENDVWIKILWVKGFGWGSS